MKKVMLIFAAILSLGTLAHAQDMNPDGYIGGFTIDMNFSMFPNEHSDIAYALNDSGGTSVNAYSGYSHQLYQHIQDTSQNWLSTFTVKYPMTESVTLAAALLIKNDFHQLNMSNADTYAQNGQPTIKLFAQPTDYQWSSTSTGFNVSLKLYFK